MVASAARVSLVPGEPGPMGSIRVVVGALAVLLVVPAPSSAQSGSLREQVLSEGRARGVDATPLLERRLRIAGETTTLAAFLDRLEAIADGTGVAGTGEIQAGALIHLTFRIGGPEVTAPYEVTRSSTVPTTSPVAVPLPATPATSPQTLIDFGGPLTQVRGSGWTVGGHIAGGNVTNVDTAGSVDAPVIVSGANAALIGDGAIDFTGHVGAITNDRSCVLGVLCVAVGFLLADGLAFYEPELVPGVARPATPTAP